MNGILPDFFKAPQLLSGLDTHEGVLVALSGGADSSALLHLLCRQRELQHFPLYAAHVNHNIRTQGFNNEADRDEQFCRNLCERLQVPLFVKVCDVPALARESGNSIETEAREARYRFFEEIMAEQSIRILATAHNASDNLETQIFNLCRGCGLDGIVGIPRKRPIPKIKDGVAVRPILDATKEEILAFCSENGIEYVTDSTNLEDDCTRNKLRHHVIPLLERQFGSPEKAGLRLAGIAEEDSDFITSVAEQIVADNKTVSLAEFRRLHIAVAKRVIQLSYRRLCNAGLEAVHVDSVLQYAKTEKIGTITLPHGISAVFTENELRFAFTSSLPEAEYTPKIKKGVLCEGWNQIDGADYKIYVTSSISSKPEPRIELNGKEHLLATYAYLKNIHLSRVFVTGRTNGDKIYDGGMGKKVKKLLCDKKISRDKRDGLPIFHLNDQIIYVPFCAVADSARADGDGSEYCIALYSIN